MSETMTHPLKHLTPLVLAVATLIPLDAKADEMGCKILLCLSSPLNPLAIAECVNPMNVLKAGLRLFNPRFPKCEEAQPKAAMTFEPQLVYEPCPQGYVALAKGQEALKMTRDEFLILTSQSTANIGDASWRFGDRMTVSEDLQTLTGIGEGDNSTEGKKKICGAGYIGQATIPKFTDTGLGYGNITSFKEVAAYERVAILDEGQATYMATVYVDGAIYRKTTVR